MVSVVVLAGGRSTRFGDRDKAVADLAGTPMIRRVADRLSDVTDDLVVNCRTDQTAAIREALAGHPAAVRYAEDEEPDRGPAAGIRNGLRAVEDTYAFVVACDMPFVEPSLAAHLRERAAGREAAVPRVDGWLQVTQAVYRAAATADACDAVLGRDAVQGRDAGCARDALAALDCAVVDEAEVERVASARSFENLNTRAEFDAAAERLHRE